MKKYRVVITKKVPEAGIEKLRKERRAQLIGGRNEYSLPRAKLKKLVKGADIIFCQLTDRIDDEVFRAAGPQLKLIANYAVGFDNIDLAAAKRRGIMVTNTPTGVSRAVAEHAWVLILACAKHVVESDSHVRAGKYKEWTPTNFLGTEIQGKTLGVIGLGRIGEATAEIGYEGFRTNILYTDVRRNAVFERTYKAKRKSLHALLKEADIVSLHVPLLPSTRHLIGAKEFAMMRKTAILVNTARGAVIDEKALIRALKSKAIAAAGIDVFEHEPKLTPGLTKLTNLVLTPHTGSATWASRKHMGETATANILAVIHGRKPKFRVC